MAAVSQPISAPEQTNSERLLAFLIGSDDLHNYAKTKANRCRTLRLRASMEAVCRAAGISPPSEKFPDKSAIRRMQDPAWWSRRVRRAAWKLQESIRIKTGKVHRRVGRYASNQAVNQIQIRQKEISEYLASMEAINEAGDTYSLEELQALSMANPKLRRNELMCRLAGFETVANEIGFEADFITLTCPSRMHARRSGDGSENPAYDGTTPSEAQKYLAKLFTRIRACLARRGCRYFGFRVAEPHHDGTPHWHLLLFVPGESREMLRGVFRSYALEDSPGEAGAEKHRVQFEAIDYEKGTATGYLAKYICKNIDGHLIDAETGQEAKRVRAWASVWGIRQFQQIGGPPVGVWRELRRIHSETTGNMEEARLAADVGNWAQYVRVQGGPCVQRKELRIRTQTIWDDREGLYGDPIGPRVLGITDGQLVVISRPHEWKISRKVEPGEPWSSVNNCTVKFDY